MRDPKRIKEVLASVEAYWIKHPDLRLCQIFSIIFADMKDTFYVEDEEVMKRLHAANPYTPTTEYINRGE